MNRKELAIKRKSCKRDRSSSIDSRDEDKPKRKRSKHKKTYSSSSDSSSSTSSSSNETSSDSISSHKKHRKKTHKEKKKKKKAKHKKHKQKKCKKKAEKKLEILEKNSKQEEKDEGLIGPDPSEFLSRAMVPMTKKEWEDKQSVVKRVYDLETGRQRLIKGDGEVMEEIVSYKRHKEINKMATAGDGSYFQTKMGLSSKPK